MVEEESRGSKERIFRVAARFFAQKGYDAVGIREIADGADVNVSMISYYFGSKSGVLKSIVKECYERYYEMLRGLAVSELPLEEQADKIVHSVVNFFRENTEIALIAFDVIPLDIPEVFDLKLKLSYSMREGMKPFHDKMGLDQNDFIQMMLGPRALLSVVYSVFEIKFASENYPQLREYYDVFNDEFFEEFSDKLVSFFLHGLEGIKKEGGKDED